MTDYYKDKQQLTDEQIAELAPDWATHYSSFSNGVIFENLTEYQIYSKGVFYGKKHKSENGDKTTREVKPIPRKNFLSSGREFGGTVCFVEISDDNIRLNCDDYLNHIVINKHDAIALAKHFSLTAEDLK